MPFSSSKKSKRTTKLNLTKKIKASNKKIEPLIIHVDGLPGAGKTYICSQLTLPNSVCIDNDDIVLEAKNYVDSLLGTPKAMPRTFNSVNKVIKKKVAELIEYHTKNGKRVIIFVGVRFMTDTALNNAHHRYFIKLDDLEAVYRRVFMRETEKIVSNADKIKAILADTKLDPDELDDMIIRTTNLALNYPPEFGNYKSMYKLHLGIARKNK
jgi:hypothetical protein